MSVEEHRATLLEVYTSFSLQYAGFVIALGVAAFAELGLLEATGAAGFWPSVLKIVVLASLLATLAGGAMTLVAYLHLRGIVDTLIGKDPQADSPPTLSELEKKYKEWAKERMDKTLIGRFIVGAAV